MSVLVDFLALLLKPDTWIVLVLGLTLLAAAYIDLRRHRIPNLLSVGAAVLGLCLQFGFYGLEGVAWGLGGYTLGLGLMLPSYATGFMGAGDVKLMAAVGAFLGPKLTLWAAALTLIAGGGIALCVLAARGGLWELLCRYGRMIRFTLTTGLLSYERARSGEAAAQRFPYAAAIGLGTLGALMETMP